jgi:serine/threonine protein kinase/Tfp pilus assembly protein PilF
MGGTDSNQEIIKKALSLAATTREEFIRSACDGDERRIAELRDALEKAERTTNSWSDLPEDGVFEGVQDTALEGQRLGPYRFVRKLGSGGMGDVWLAERADNEYQQRVAIKLVRAGLLSAQVQGRLRMERQILATLQHPNIARLLDGGRADDGTPYLVLEYIDGEPIDLYCDRRRLSLAERIRLFQQVCATVHYAHQNLIVHRDLKPNNILITQDGQPKLLDFGIAKPLDARITERTLAVTHFGYRVMTPAHASPEQIRGETITTASDIYVLGVLLYELLAGRKPFQFVGTTLSEMERMVCEQTPPLPSAMIEQTAREMPELLDDIAACRSISPSRLRKELQGDLDNIVAMAMRKETERRYSSAEHLAADLERHLQGQPVVATGDSWPYRARKFISRHALAVAASAAAVAMLGIFSTITFLQAKRIAAERDVAHIERTRAEQISSFLVELFELSDPSKSRGDQVTARELLDIGARRANVGLTNQPETRATLLGTIGKVYNSLGLYADSIALLEQALETRIAAYGPSHMEVAGAMDALADALLEANQFERAAKLLHDAAAMKRELVGEDALEMAPTLAAQAKLAHLRGDLDSAEAGYKRALQIYTAHDKAVSAEAASAYGELASLHSFRGGYVEAARLLRTALDIDRQALGRDHPHTATHLHNLAVNLHLNGDLTQAEPLYAEAAELLRTVLGETHPQTLDALSNYGRFLHRKGDLKLAQEILTRAVAANRLARGDRHAYVGHDLVNLAIVRIDLGDYAAAQRDLRDALGIYEEVLPQDHPYVASALAHIGRAQLEQGDAIAAEKTLRDAMRIASKTLPADSPQLAAMNSSLGRALLAQCRTAEADPLLRGSLPLLARSHGEQAQITARTQSALESLAAGRNTCR